MKTFTVKINGMTTGQTQATHEGAAVSAVLRSMDHITVGKSISITVERVK